MGDAKKNLKGKQTAYERWEMSSFADENLPIEPTAPTLEQAEAQKKEEERAVSEKIAQIFESVRKEGYTKGMQEGFAVGMAQAQEHAEDDRQRFLALMASFRESLEKSDEKIADDLLSLALDIAKSMLKEKLNVDPATVLPVVRDAIHYLPNVQQPARILVNHDDAELLRKYLAEELANQKWQVQEDNNIERGGCVVETGANQIDATNEVRWKRLADALGQKNDWLLP